MPEVQGAEVKIAVSVGEEKIVFVCRRPSGPEVSRFLTSRFRTVRNKVEHRLLEAREEFANLIIRDAENITFRTAKGELLPLNASASLSDEDRLHWGRILGAEVKSWLDLVPVNWKVAVAQYFEEATLDTEGN